METIVFMLSFQQNIVQLKMTLSMKSQIRLIVMFILSERCLIPTPDPDQDSGIIVKPDENQEPQLLQIE